MIGFGGGQDRLEANFALLESVAEAYGDDWWFLSAYAFAHNELGYHEKARRLVQRALELHPHSGHSAHTMAHVFFETGDHSAGVEFLEGWLPDFPRQAQIYSHLAWHLALFQLAGGHARATCLNLRTDAQPRGAGDRSLRCATLQHCCGGMTSMACRALRAHVRRWQPSQPAPSHGLG